MRRRGLKSAIAKLESRKRFTQFCWPLIIAQYPEEGAGDIVGLKAGDDEYPRLYRDKDFPAFALRVKYESGTPMQINAPTLLVALYCAPQLLPPRRHL